MARHQLPVKKPRYNSLPLGAVKPKGWMKRQLEIQAKGIPGRADEFFFKNEFWLGGNGADDPSRRPTDAGASHLVLGWLSHMQTMAYMLDDKTMLDKLQGYVEYFISTQKEDGSFGPEQPKDSVFPDAPREFAFYEAARVSAAGILLDYYDHSKDERALNLVKNFIKKYYGEVIQPDGWSWCNNVSQMGVRGIALKLYDLTGDQSYLDAVEKFISHITPENDLRTQFQNHDLKFLHGGIYGSVGRLAQDYLFSGDEICKDIIYDAIAWFDETQGQAPGHHTAHEFIAKYNGTNPTMGAECCLIAGDYFSMRTLFEVFEDNTFADRAEEIMFNAVPAFTTADTWARQYDQQVNQVLCSVAKRRFDNRDDANIFGINPHYPCCNASIGGPLLDYINHQWCSTPDGGLAAFSYSACEVTATVADGKKAVLTVDSDYPFRGTDMSFTVHVDEPVEFPIYLRAPNYIGDYNERTGILVDSYMHKVEPGDTYVIRRLWHNGDTFQMNVPMNTKFIERTDDACAVKRGPLYYALRVGEAYHQIVQNYLGSADWEIFPTTPWNVALYTSFQAAYASIVEEHNPIPEVPWAHEGAVLYDEDRDRFYTWHGKEPVILHARGRLVNNWGMHRVFAQADEIMPEKDRDYSLEVKVELIPYGCTNLRIAEFPSIL